jgi:hypothetical protein
MELKQSLGLRLLLRITVLEVALLKLLVLRATFPVGTTTITYKATDAALNTFSSFLL